ncbi:MAG TPA: alpha/beta hydrolase [Thermoanaerobaculia bacterium]|jgi:pimeloyl-ACP methyl ester carboxylesterase|nr:alpha/beta hydrolase [Thermoanaerobaculia bacterium]
MLARLFLLATVLYLRLLGARRKRLVKGPLSLAYYTIGPEGGEPWVLLHGLGSVAAGWSPVLRGLRRSCRMLVPELSALGGTECPGGGLGVQDGVEILTALIDKELGAQPVTVAGLSLGGWMAARLALAHPERVSRLILIDAGGYRDQDWQTIQSLVTVGDLAGVDRLYSALFVRVPWLMRLSRTAFLRAYTSPGVRHVLQGLSEADTFTDADLARLRMPVALIWAEGDGLFTVETARAMAAALPQARLDLLPRCGHAVHLECPRALVQALQHFRRATAAAAGPAGEPVPTAAGRRA